MLQKTRQLAPSLLACSLLLLGGCATPQVVNQLTASGPSIGRLSLFGHRDGLGSITIRIIDQRKKGFQVQDLADATADLGFNAVLFRLSNATKLKGGFRLIAPASTSNGVYSAAFTGIPSDLAGGYTLTAGLFRGIATPSNSADAGFSDLSKKIGEGASTSISLTAGSAQTVTIKINSVGNVVLDSANTVISAANPIYEFGDTTATLDTKINLSNNPNATAVGAYILNLSNSTLSVSPTASVAASPSTTMLSFSGLSGLAAGTYNLCVEASGSYAGGPNVVLTRKYKQFQIENAASINLNLN